VPRDPSSDEDFTGHCSAVVHVARLDRAHEIWNAVYSYVLHVSSFERNGPSLVYWLYGRPIQTNRRPQLRKEYLHEAWQTMETDLLRSVSR